MGIEPTLPAWKAGTLPLSYTRSQGCTPVIVRFLQKTTDLRGEWHHSLFVEEKMMTWVEQDSNLRRLPPPDLQSGPFSHLGIHPVHNRIAKTEELAS